MIHVLVSPFISSSPKRMASVLLSTIMEVEGIPVSKPKQLDPWKPWFLTAVPDANEVLHHLACLETSWWSHVAKTRSEGK